MTTKIITTFDPSKYEQYGRKMLQTLNEKIQDDDIEVIVYYDGNPEDIHRFERCTALPFSQYCGRFHEPFAQKARKKQEGKIVHEPNSDEYENNREFLFDALRFSYKWFAMIEAQAEFDVDYLIWLDADTVACDRIDEEFFSKLIGENELLAYLGRTKPYTETGFVLFNAKHPEIDRFFDRMEDMYHRQEIFYMPYWIDCVVFDYIREELEKWRQVTNRNLTPQMTGHVWERSPLSTRLVHNKGRRKM